MSVEQNKQVVRQWLEATWKRDADRVASLMTDDATYWGGGKHPRFNRIKTKADWCNYLKTPSPFKNSELSLKTRAITAEDDRVAIEVESYGVITANDKIYNNTYHFLFTLRDGKISSVREYFDTAHVNDVLPPPPAF